MAIKEQKKINLGCGNRKLEGWLNHDRDKESNPDLCFDLEFFPYPIESNSVDEILLDNVYEHINNVCSMMEEIHRILKPGGKVTIICPYQFHVTAWCEPTHVRAVNEVQFSFFVENEKNNQDWECYKGNKFSRMYYEYMYTDFGKFLPFRKYLRTIGFVVKGIKVVMYKW